MNKPSRFTEKLPILTGRPFIQYGASVMLCLLALWLRWQLDDVFPPGYPYVIFFPPVIVSSFLFGPRPGIVAALLCGLFAWYFFIPPFMSFDLEKGAFTTLLFYAGVATVDIVLVHLMQAANQRLRLARENVRELAEERGKLIARSEVLFQELQHRVGNNLQMVGAVLSLQMRQLEDSAARGALADAAARLQVIGGIQRQLYRPDGELMPLDGFIREVLGQLMASSGRPGITCNVDADTSLVIRPGSGIPVALIVSEAVANAIEHGLGQRDTGTITVRVAHRNDDINLTVEDDGIGLAPEFDPERSDNVGLRISRVLCQQLDGRMSLENIGSADSISGVRMTLNLPTARLIGTGRPLE